MDFQNEAERREKKRKYMQEYALKNKEHLRRRRLERYWNNREKELSRCREWHNNNRECVREYRQNYYRTHADYLKNYHKIYYHANKEKQKNYMHERNKLFKEKVLLYYSNNDIKCACCGEREIQFLSIDHINGGGTKHIKEVGGGTGFYRWLIKNNFPAGYQVLCMNCNFAKGKSGCCPHEKKQLNNFSLSKVIENELRN
jgi:hypothetical protein